MTPEFKVDAIDRALMLLVELAKAGPDGAQLGELAGRAGVNKSTAYRALTTMRHRGFAVQTADGSYVLGPTAASLSQSHFSPRNLAQALNPALVALCNATRELVHLGVAVGDHVQYVDKVEPDRPVRVWSAIGRLVPTSTTAMGRALLAARDLDRNHLAAYLTQSTTSDGSLDTLVDAVELARKRGFATEIEENEPGIGCVGAALLQGDDPIAALSITVPVERLPEDRIAALAASIDEIVTPLLPPGLSLATPESRTARQQG